LALAIIEPQPPDVFNHNLKTVPGLCKDTRPGSCFEWPLDLLENFKGPVSKLLAKFGLMLGLGAQIFTQFV